MLSTASSIQWLNASGDEATPDDTLGGKAQGLRRLSQWGLTVPNGFVILNAERGIYPLNLEECYRQLGSGKVAVRSSALGEDGANTSFAGQYESVLNVEGLEALHRAIDHCVESLSSQRASAYQQQQRSTNLDHTIQMNVLVQTMVEASAAGVVFTVDPVSGRHDRLVVDAIQGLGEALVSGEATPDHYEFDRDGQLVYSELIGDTPILSEALCKTLCNQAQQAVAKAGHPLDLEWAIDQRGQIFWLQARPITTIGSDLNELDTPIKPDDVVTRCNVGEMMPGASCPLTFSTTGRGIENGMQHMHVSYAGRPSVNDEWTQIAMSHGRLFINLSGSLAAAATVLGVDAKSMGYSVCGGLVEELKEPPKKSWPRRLLGTLRLLRYLQTADSAIAKFAQKAGTFSLPVSGTSHELAAALDSKLPFYSEANAVHLQSSTTSGFASNILQAMISGGQESTPAQQAEAARLMAGANGVESAVLVEQLDAITDQIADSPTEAQLFVDASPTDAIDCLLNTRPEIRSAYQGFLERHGHRGYRELCMREPCWADNPESLVATMQASVAARLSGAAKSTRPPAVDVSSLSRGLRWILPKAHNAIRRREATKSLLVDIANRFKRCYRALGQQLVREGKLEDADQVFFFTHDELMTFVQGKADVATWQQKTKARRVALEFQNRLEFEEICVGKPVPIDTRLRNQHQDGAIVGRPVSSGIVEATARVAFTVAEAAALKPGEILVAPITDVGWTPYFNMISGLITDVGSSVSHGAVIAREYGLPAIVNTRVATQRIKTGDKVHLNADTGVVTLP
ncbi:hypothetical protein I6N98_04825 [Spongiibacter nanhainus]|uniref:Pyruvate,water dikinase n=1 Tax=Spongiibacter nanhainus TaxID=2794344 RepID=A0A7T4R2W7_9GAMM|nr:PEP/pyruvate-binding domain-containing protein [Spongiibacter nanhainus]QQD19182.1 hypothetical protein I6N98_04825 [Spongiibacter nanhainus]